MFSLFLIIVLIPTVFGVGKNPYFEKKEEERKLRRVKKRMKEEMENSNRSAEL